MPRQTVVINNFVGGLCNSGSHRDLREIELAAADGIRIEGNGEIRVGGLFTALTSKTNYTTTNINVAPGGYGLYIFSAEQSSTGGNANTDYLAIGVKNTSKYKIVVISETDGTRWNSTSGSSWIAVTSTSDTSEFHPVMFHIDNALRICDGNLDSTKSTNRWFGYVNSTNFNGSTYAESINQWVEVENLIDGPEMPYCGLYGAIRKQCTATGTATRAYVAFDSGFAGAIGSGSFYLCNETDSTFVQLDSWNAAYVDTTDIAGVYNLNDWVHIVPKNGGININVSTAGDSRASWAVGQYELFQTLVYESDQESKPEKMISGGAGISVSATTVRFAG